MGNRAVDNFIHRQKEAREQARAPVAPPVASPVTPPVAPPREIIKDDGAALENGQRGYTGGKGTAYTRSVVDRLRRDAPLRKDLAEDGRLPEQRHVSPGDQVIPGAKSKKKHLNRVKVDLTPQLLDALYSAVDRYGLTVNEIIRGALFRYLGMG